MMYLMFHYFRRRLNRIEAKLNKIEQKEKEIMANVQDLQAKIAAVAAAVDQDVAQDLKVVEAIDALIAKVEALPGGADLQPEIDALEAASAKLTGDNAAVQAAIDKAVPPTV